MIDKPPACLSCNGTIFETKTFDFCIEIDEMYLTARTDVLECQDCGTPLMNTKQTDTIMKLIDLTNSIEKAT